MNNIIKRPLTGIKLNHSLAEIFAFVGYPVLRRSAYLLILHSMLTVSDYLQLNQNKCSMLAEINLQVRFLTHMELLVNSSHTLYGA